MSLWDYKESKEIMRALPGAGFYSTIMAAARRADSANMEKLKAAWPEVVEELQARYNAPGGLLEGESE